MEKIFLCEIIKRISTSKVQTTPVDFSSVSPLSDLFRAIYSEKTSKSDAGLLSVQELEIKGIMSKELVIDMVSIPQIFELRFSDGNIHQWGDLKHPVIGAAGVKREGNVTSITFNRISPDIEL
jgi:hypothetical protein